MERPSFQSSHLQVPSPVPVRRVSQTRTKVTLCRNTKQDEVLQETVIEVILLNAKCPGNPTAVTSSCIYLRKRNFVREVYHECLLVLIFSLIKNFSNQEEKDLSNIEQRPRILLNYCFNQHCPNSSSRVESRIPVLDSVSVNNIQISIMVEYSHSMIFFFFA